MRDTTPEAAEIQLAAVRAMEPAARLRIALDASELSRRLTLAGLRSRYPRHTQRQLVELLHGQSLTPARSRPSTP